MKFPQWNLLLIRNRIKYLFQIHIIKLPCKLHTEVVQEFVIQKVINGYCNLVKMTDHFLMNASNCINKKEFSFTFNTSFFCKPISLNFENDTACPFLNICSSNTAFPMVLQMSCKHIGCKQWIIGADVWSSTMDQLKSCARYIITDMKTPASLLFSTAQIFLYWLSLFAKPFLLLNPFCCGICSRKYANLASVLKF